MIRFRTFIDEAKDDPCWKDYKQIGMKNKNGKKVPNCVPKETKEAPPGTYFTRSGQLKKGDPASDGPGGDKLASDPLDKQRKTIVNLKNYPNKKNAQSEATYQGKKVTLNKPSPGDVKKSKVYVDPDGDGKAKKVNFGDKNMTIKKHIPARKKSFRARHNCDNPGPKYKARYWSCKAW